MRLKSFAIKAVVLTIVWWALYNLWLKPDARLDTALTKICASSVAEVISWAGFDTDYVFIPDNEEPAFNVRVDQRPILLVGSSCNALELFVLFLGFIFAYPGPNRHKLWYIPVGILTIHVVNIIRMLALAFNFVYFRTTFEFNHKYTFLIIIYGFTFFLWMTWVNKFSNLPNKKEATHA